MKKGVAVVFIFAVLILSLTMVSAFSFAGFFKDLFGFGDNKPVIEGAPVDNAGFIRVYVYKEGSEKLIRNVNVTIYDDSLTEVDTRKSRSGRVTFLNIPLVFSEQVLKLYDDRREEAPKVYSYDTRTYYIDVSAKGYKPKVVEHSYIQGDESEVIIHLEKNGLINSFFTGNTVSEESEEEVSAVEEEDLHRFQDRVSYPLKLGSEEDIFPSDTCKLILNEIRVSPFAEDRKPFNIEGSLRTTGHCSGEYLVSLSLGDVSEVTINGNGEVPFTLGPFTKRYGNGIGALECPVISVAEILDDGQIGFSSAIGFRLPVAACDDPELCSTGTGEDVKTACEAYLDGDCGATAYEQLCEWEREEFDGSQSWCAYSPQNGGSPGGGGREALDHAIRQDVGKQCCFCGYDAKPRDLSHVDGFMESCRKLFSNSFDHIDSGSGCEVTEVFSMQIADKALKQLGEDHQCKGEIIMYSVAHGSSDSWSGWTAEDSESQFVATTENLVEVAKLCLTSFPNNDIHLVSGGCKSFMWNGETKRYMSRLKRHMSKLKSITGKDQVLTMTGAQVSEVFDLGYANPNYKMSGLVPTGKDELTFLLRDYAIDNWILRRSYEITPHCVEEKLSYCKNEGVPCPSPSGIDHSCLDKDGSETYQYCCPHKFNEKDLFDGLYSKTGVDYPDGCPNLIPKTPYTYLP